MDKAKMLPHLCLLLALCWSSTEASPKGANSTSASDVFQLPRTGRAGGLITGIVANIIAGTSLVGTSTAALAASLSAQGYTVGTVIEVENHTKWRLHNAQSWTRWGYIKTSPSIVKPGEKEAWTTHKTKGTVVGSAGVIYYQVDGLDEVLAIVWHAPYNQNHLSNYLAIGLYSSNDFNGFDSWRGGYNTLRNGDPSETSYTTSPTWPWCGRKYYYSIELCKTYSPYLEVQGSMGTSHHPTIEIKVFARDPSNRAPDNKIPRSLIS